MDAGPASAVAFNICVADGLPKWSFANGLSLRLYTGQPAFAGQNDNAWYFRLLAELPTHSTACYEL